MLSRHILWLPNRLTSCFSKTWYWSSSVSLLDPNPFPPPPPDLAQPAPAAEPNLEAALLASAHSGLWGNAKPKLSNDERTTSGLILDGGPLKLIKYGSGNGSLSPMAIHVLWCVALSASYCYIFFLCHNLYKVFNAPWKNLHKIQAIPWKHDRVWWETKFCRSNLNQQAVVLKFSMGSHVWRATLNSIKKSGLKWYFLLICWKCQTVQVRW